MIGTCYYSLYKNKCRRVRDRTKGRQQSYFKGVLPMLRINLMTVEGLLQSTQSKDSCMKSKTANKSEQLAR